MLLCWTQGAWNSDFESDSKRSDAAEIEGYRYYYSETTRTDFGIIFVPHSRWNRIFFSEHTSRTHHAVLKAHARCIGLLHHRCWLFSIKVIILDIDLKLCHHTPGHRNSVEPESGDWMTEYCYLGLHFFLLDIFFNDVDSTDLMYNYTSTMVQLYNCTTIALLVVGSQHVRIGKNPDGTCTMVLEYLNEPITYGF